MSNFITLLASFTLSTIAYLGAQNTVKVQHIEFDEPIIIQPSYEVIEFQEGITIEPNVEVIEFQEGITIEPNVEVIEFGEDMILAQATDPNDDGDGENIDMMNDHWCEIWPDHPVCDKNEEDEDGESDEEYGC
jgi:hypothetical protein